MTRRGGRVSRGGRALGFGAVAVLAFHLPASAIDESPFRFRTVEIDADAGVGLAVAAEDVDGDGRLDILAASSSEVFWRRNPDWTRFPISGEISGGNVCLAARDLDGDGLPEVVVGADWRFDDTREGGSLHLLRRRADPSEGWEIRALATEPTLHRVRWFDAEGDGRPELVVAPLKGRNSTPPLFRESAVRLFALRPPADAFAGEWTSETIDDSTLHVLHNVRPFRLAGSDCDSLLAASFEGVHEFARDDEGAWTSRRIVAGNPVGPPDSGAGEVALGRLADGRRMLATIEPWHGSNAAVYVENSPGAASEAGKAAPLPSPEGWTRTVADDGFAQGHAVAFADFDGDGDDDLLAGFRGAAPPRNLPGLHLYRRDRAAGTWAKFALDDGGMATEDAVAADMNGDGRPDAIAFGRATRNLRYYENRGRAAPQETEP